MIFHKLSRIVQNQSLANVPVFFSLKRGKITHCPAGAPPVGVTAVIFFAWCNAFAPNRVRPLRSQGWAQTKTSPTCDKQVLFWDLPIVNFYILLHTFTLIYINFTPKNLTHVEQHKSSTKILRLQDHLTQQKPSNNIRIIYVHLTSTQQQTFNEFNNHLTFEFNNHLTWII